MFLTVYSILMVKIKIKLKLKCFAKPFKKGSLNVEKFGEILNI